MGLLQTITTALGLQRPLTIVTNPTFSLSQRAQRALDALPAATLLQVTTVPLLDGWMPTAVPTAGEADASRPTHAGLVMSAQDLKRLAGLTLDHDGSRWKMTTHLDLRAKPTPNPNGRIYSFNRVIHEGTPAFFTAGHPDQATLVNRILAADSIVSILVRSHTLTVQRTDAAPWDGIDRIVEAELRGHLLRCAPMIDGRQTPTRSGRLDTKVAALLQTEILPRVHADGGHIALVRISDKTAYVRLEGACTTCPASTLTLKGAVERRLTEAFPGEIMRVEPV